MFLATNFFVYYLWFCLFLYEGSLFTLFSSDELMQFYDSIPSPTLENILLLLCWVCFNVLLAVFGPGRWIKGSIPEGSDTGLDYHLNGLFAFLVTWLIFLSALSLNLLSLNYLYDQFGSLLISANILVFLFSIFLYYYGKFSGKASDHSAPIDAFIMGSSLNPRIKKFDFKFFCEDRPGLIAWTIINALFVAKQYQLNGFVTNSMILINIFQFIYVLDYFIFEEYILSTWDIRKEKFGWMLAWGDLIWVPFTYTLQACYLVSHPVSLPFWAVLGLIVLNMTGYIIFRSANIQKHLSRIKPTGLIWGKPPEFIKTRNGALLLVSGWWGIARHMNYAGDILMALAWCLTCGFNNLLPYFYVIYITILLIHRERRDHSACRKKYGADWDAYCRKVPWRIFPGIY